MSRTLERIVAAANVPFLLVRNAHESTLSLLHVNDRPEPVPTGGVTAIPSGMGQVATTTTQTRSVADADEVLAAPRRNATELGIAVDVHLLRSTRVAEELIATAEEVQADVLIVGAERRTDGSFLGHTVAHLLQYAPMAVGVVIIPRQ